MHPSAWTMLLKGEIMYTCSVCKFVHLRSTEMFTFSVTKSPRGHWGLAVHIIATEWCLSSNTNYRVYPRYDTANYFVLSEYVVYSCVIIDCAVPKPQNIYTKCNINQYFLYTQYVIIRLIIYIYSKTILMFSFILHTIHKKRSWYLIFT